MVSRDTSVHVGAVLVALALLGAVEVAGLGSTSGPASLGIALAVYGLVLGGSHLYLAVRGEDGLVPVSARWRYLAALVVFALALAIIGYGGGRTLGPVSLETVGTVVAALAVVGYLAVESVSGYRATRPETD